jgi:hypothetical protein
VQDPPVLFIKGNSTATVALLIADPRFTLCRARLLLILTYKPTLVGPKSLNSAGSYGILVLLARALVPLQVESPSMLMGYDR